MDRLCHHNARVNENTNRQNERKERKEIDGIKVFEKIREKTSLVYVILVTVSKISEIE